MIRVGIEKNWSSMWVSEERFLNQSKSGKGSWGRILFHIGYDEGDDFLLILNRSKRSFVSRLPPSRIWGVIQEPPNEIFSPMHYGQPWMGRVYNQMNCSADPRRQFILAPPMVPWFVNMSYGEAESFGPPVKKFDLSCITSKTVFFAGHLARKEMLGSAIKLRPDIKLFGRGFEFVEEKEAALMPFRYSLVMENFRNDYYMTEKIFDCLLCWTVPIYYGAPNISDFFPQGAVLPVDGTQQSLMSAFSLMSRDDYERRLPALAEARRRILEEHSFFARMSRDIEEVSGAHREEGITPVGSLSPSILSSWVRSGARKIAIRFSGA